jgi:hypothetical protein
LLDKIINKCYNKNIKGKEKTKMKYYETYVETYHNGEYIGCQYGGAILTEDELPALEIIDLTWKNLNEMHKKIGLGLDFNIWNFKKGRLVSFFNSSLFNKNTWDIKEWKSSLNITIRIYNQQKRATMYDLRHFDAKDVQKYLEK